MRGPKCVCCYNLRLFLACRVNERLPNVSKVVETVVMRLDAVTTAIGKAAAWLSVAMVIIVFFIVMARYLFNNGSIVLQELVTYLHAAMFIGVSAYALKMDAHVRVDVFYRNFNPVTKGWINLFGVLFFLFPVIIVVGWYSVDYVLSSWRIREHSQEAGGMPALFLMKSLIFVFVGLFFLQGLAELGRNMLLISGQASAQDETKKPGGAL